MLGNDYVWKQAEEPTDSVEGQVDTVSMETDSTGGHSPLLKIGLDLLAASTGDSPILVVPNAKGSSSSVDWAPPFNWFDRTTLFGSANYRANLARAAGWEITAFVEMQGEQDARDASLRPHYTSNHSAVVNGFRVTWPGVPWIYGQLAAHRNNPDNSQQQVIREAQRRMESGSGYPEALAAHFMVVGHDLSLTDSIHLDQAGVIELGRRMALAVREHVLGEAVNGTGPRLVSITMPTSATVKVKTTAVINDHSTYDDYFSVFDDGAPIGITSAGRDASDASAVLLTLEAAPVGSVTVEYSPPPGRPLGVVMQNVVKDDDGLPLPAFGPIPITT